jgi:polyketide synthase PksM
LLRSYQARVVWIGRRQLSEEIEQKLRRLGQLGPTPRYVQADATQGQQLREAYRQIVKEYGAIHGVVQAALVLKDKSVAQMEEERFRASLAAKVDVSVRVGQVFEPQGLDFVLFFSSLQSFSKAAGQSNYAAGCVFQDAFAQRLAQQWPCAVKVMNWGYWGSVGSVATPAYRDRMAQLGVGSIEPAEGMVALERLLSAPVKQLALLKTSQPRILSGLGVIANEQVRVAEAAARVVEELSGSTQRQLKSEAGEEERGQELERLMKGLLFEQLQQLGLLRPVAVSVREWEREQGVPGVYGRWVRESLRLLLRDGSVEFDGERVRGLRPADGAAVWRQWEECRQQWRSDTSLSAQMRLLEATLRSLPGVLTGKQRATEVVFPQSSMELVEGIYRDHRVAQYFNAVLADAVQEYVQARVKGEGQARLRILEVGAGTGSASAAVFARLKGYEGWIEEYCYTDVSQAFLQHAQRKYAGEAPYLSCRVFDVERPPQEQGIGEGAYDVVIASNVVHATKRIGQSLRHVKGVLKRNGVLVLNEMCGGSVFAHLTFGLLEGWWRHEDGALRIEGTPALSVQSWQEVLQEEGYGSLLWPAQWQQSFGQQIIVAQSDGVIRVPAAPRAGTPTPSQDVRRIQPPPAVVAAAPRQVTEQAAREYILQTIVEQLEAGLGIESRLIDADEPFAEYGLDSILGVRTVEGINQALSIRLTSTSVFDYPTPNKLTAHILAQYRQDIETRLDTSAVSEIAAVAPPDTPSTDRSPGERSAQPQAEGDLTEPRRSPEPSGGRESIAIIGMSARYARAESVQELWRSLAQAEELVEEVTRWDLGKAYAAAQIHNGCRRGGLLRDIDRFDPLFFNISGTEAIYMDPQQRLFLQESWKALEDGGYAGASIGGRRCGVYVGCNGADYPQLFGQQLPPAQAMWGSAPSILSARIAYMLDLKGPAITVDTACSSSMVAIHLACQALRSGETDLALAGGVYVQCTPAFYVIATQAGMLSPSGRCATFDERADGFVPGEGVGVVLLKRLRDALADGDHVYAVIRGSAINQDGATNGITAPNALSQEQLEREVYEGYGIHPEQIQMVEAHGTGTRLGDPIEYQALTRAFRHDTDKRHFCALGSIKTNIGHTTAASGVAGVIKAVLALQHRQIPPSLHFENGNAHIDMQDSPFYVNTKLRDWPVEVGKRRCAAVSSFGMSGTNAHLVLEEAPVSARSTALRPGYLLVLSARTAAQLTQQAERLVRHCEQTESIDCGNLSYTLLLCRKHFDHRLTCVAQDKQELLTSLRRWLQKGKAAKVAVAVLPETERREQLSLRGYGNHCIQQCRDGAPGGQYLEHLSTIAELYLQGYELEYAQLFAGAGCSRIPLPTYPFANERYWVTPASEATIDQLIDEVSADDLSVDGALRILDSLTAERAL